MLTQDELNALAVMVALLLRRQQLPQIATTAQGDKGDKGDRGPAGAGLPDFSVNAATVDSGYADGSIVLRTGGTSNPAGAFTGSGIGNKAIFGVFGFHRLPMANLQSVSYTWSNVTGPGGPSFIPPASTVTTPYVNVLVDFNPNGGGDLRVLVLLSDSLNPTVSANLGTYSNPGGLNVLTYAWTSAQDALIVASTPTTIPGGVPAHISVGPSWLDKTYRWSQLAAANPAAVLVDAWPNDNGMPAGAVLPAIVLVSGDSGNLTKSGKRIASMAVNGRQIVP